MGTLLCPPFGCGLLDLCYSAPVGSSACSDDATGTPRANRNPFKESLKSLEADVMHANTLLSGEMLRDSEGASLQMRLSFSPLAPLLLFLVQWADCSLAGALGLLRVLIFKVYRNGHSTANVYERKASLTQFSGYLYPALQQLYPGISDSEFREQQRQCRESYTGRTGHGCASCVCAGADVSAGSPFTILSSSSSTTSSCSTTASTSSCSTSLSSHGISRLSGTASMGACGCASVGACGCARMGACGCAGMSSEWKGCCASAPEAVDEEFLGCSKACMVERERERECGICLEEPKTQVALPMCGHCMCKKCFNDWNKLSKSCPFCRRGLTRVDSGDLWELVESSDVQDMARFTRDNIRRFFIFVHRLPIAFADNLLDHTPSERRPLM